MELIYEPVGWKNGEAGGTPVNEDNLNKMEKGISECVRKINELDNDTTGIVSQAEHYAGNAEVSASDASRYANDASDYATNAVLARNDAREYAEEAKKIVSGVIAEVWDANKTYTVGSYCIYSNSLWKCLVQNSGQTPTEGTYWTKTNVVSEIKTGSGEGGKGGIDYSLEEQDTGLKWIDGKTIYSKTIDCGVNYTIPQGSVVAVEKIIPDGIDTPIKARFYVKSSNDSAVDNVNYSYYDMCWHYFSNESWMAKSDRHVYFYIEYTKI